MEDARQIAAEVVKEWRSLPDEDRSDRELVSIISHELNALIAKIVRLEGLCAIEGISTKDIVRR